MKKGSSPLPSDPCFCPECLAKQQIIDKQTEDIKRLKDKLRRQERTAKEEPFGASTPSSQKLVKSSSQEEQRAKRGGAVCGHKGHGRKSASHETADVVEQIRAPSVCPDCGGILEPRGARKRTVYDCNPVEKTTRLYVNEGAYCAHCRKTFRGTVPGVLPRSIISNTLLGHIAKWHYHDGLTAGCVCRQFGLGEGTVFGRLKALAQILEPAKQALIEQYRKSAVKHADETGWRNDGANGYTWAFLTKDISIFECRNTRAGSVAEEIFGEADTHTGTLVVDRYAAYNKFTGNIQYCFEHLKRDVIKLATDNPDNKECVQFSETFRPLLCEAMTLRTKEKDPVLYREKAIDLRRRIECIVNKSARNPSVQNIQSIFRENAHRLYHWVENLDVPAENNRAERGLRTLVIARKISFGSQSEQGLWVRSILMSVANTIALRNGDVAGVIKNTLDTLVDNPKLDVAEYLFGKDGIAKPSTA